MNVVSSTVAPLLTGSALCVALLAGGCTADAKAPPKASAATTATAATAATTAATTNTATAGGPALDLEVQDIDGKPVQLKDFRGKALLIVNVASECGYTPQYAELQALSAEYAGKGLVVLGFPSNDFGGQEPGDGAAIKKFASEEYGVTFPLFAKVHATGADIAPLYKTLTAQKGPVKWNFTKFLVDPQGQVVAKFDSGVAPSDPTLRAAIDAVLPKG